MQLHSNPCVDVRSHFTPHRRNSITERHYIIPNCRQYIWIPHICIIASVTDSINNKPTQTK